MAETIAVSTVVICGVCEHEWPGPADGACPRCGNFTEDHVPTERPIGWQPPPWFAPEPTTIAVGFASDAYLAACTEHRRLAHG